jgi:hydrogenase maturation protein HypF
VLDTCLRLREQFDIDEVALSGGVWQNTFLLSLTVGLLQENEFKVYLHRQVPTNDGGLALGQAVVAIARLRNGSL